MLEEITRRWGSNLLRELTNPGKTGDQQIDQDRLTAAVDDAQAEFGLRAGVAFDESIPAHRSAVAFGAIYYLHTYSGMQTDAMDAARTRWEAWLNRASERIGDRSRLLPVSSSPLAPSQQRQGTRPDFDRERFQDVVADLPGSDEVV